MIKGEKIFYLVFIEMAQGRGQGPCLAQNVKFFWKCFSYVIILIQI